MSTAGEDGDDATPDGPSVVRRSEYAEVREYAGAKGTVTIVHTCPACGADVGPDSWRSLPWHLARDHDADDFPITTHDSDDRD